MGVLSNFGKIAISVARAAANSTASVLKTAADSAAKVAASAAETTGLQSPPALSVLAKDYLELVRKTEGWEERINPEDIKVLEYMSDIASEEDWNELEEAKENAIQARFPYLYQQITNKRINLRSVTHDSEVLKTLFTNAEGYIPLIATHKLGMPGSSYVKKGEEFLIPTLSFIEQESLFRAIESKAPGFISREIFSNYVNDNRLAEFLSFSYQIPMEGINILAGYAGIDSELLTKPLSDPQGQDSVARAIVMIVTFAKLWDHLPSKDGASPIEFLVDDRGAKKSIADALQYYFDPDNTDAGRNIKNLNGLLKQLHLPELSSSNLNSSIYSELEQHLPYLDARTKIMVKDIIAAQVENTKENAEKILATLNSPTLTYGNLVALLTDLNEPTLLSIQSEYLGQDVNSSTLSVNLSNLFPALTYEQRKHQGEAYAKEIPGEVFNMGKVQYQFFRDFVREIEEKLHRPPTNKEVFEHLLKLPAKRENIHEYFNAFFEVVGKQKRLPKLLNLMPGMPNLFGMPDLNTALSHTFICDENDLEKLLNSHFKNKFPEDATFSAPTNATSLTQEFISKIEHGSSSLTNKQVFEYLLKMSVDTPSLHEYFNEFFKAVDIYNRLPNAQVTYEALVSAAPVLTVDQRVQLQDLYRDKFKDNFSPLASQNVLNTQEFNRIKRDLFGGGAITGEQVWDYLLGLPANKPNLHEYFNAFFSANDISKRFEPVSEPFNVAKFYQELVDAAPILNVKRREQAVNIFDKKIFGEFIPEAPLNDEFIQKVMTAFGLTESTQLNNSHVFKYLLGLPMSHPNLHEHFNAFFKSVGVLKRFKPGLTAGDFNDLTEYVPALSAEEQRELKNLFNDKLTSGEFPFPANKVFFTEELVRKIKEVCGEKPTYQEVFSYLLGLSESATLNLHEIFNEFFKLSGISRRLSPTSGGKLYDDLKNVAPAFNATQQTEIRNAFNGKFSGNFDISAISELKTEIANNLGANPTYEQVFNYLLGLPQNNLHQYLNEFFKQARISVKFSALPSAERLKNAMPAFSMQEQRYIINAFEEKLGGPAVSSLSFINEVKEIYGNTPNVMDVLNYLLGLPVAKQDVNHFNALFKLLGVSKRFDKMPTAEELRSAAPVLTVIRRQRVKAASGNKFSESENFTSTASPLNADFLKKVKSALSKTEVTNKEVFDYLLGMPWQENLHDYFNAFFQAVGISQRLAKLSQPVNPEGLCQQLTNAAPVLNTVDRQNIKIKFKDRIPEGFFTADATPFDEDFIKKVKQANNVPEAASLTNQQVFDYLLGMSGDENDFYKCLSHFFHRSGVWPYLIALEKRSTAIIEKAPLLTLHERKGLDELLEKHFSGKDVRWNKKLSELEETKRNKLNETLAIRALMTKKSDATIQDGLTALLTEKDTSWDDIYKFIYAIGLTSVLPRGKSGNITQSELITEIKNVLPILAPNELIEMIDSLTRYADVPQVKKAEFKVLLMDRQTTWVALQNFLDSHNITKKEHNVLPDAGKIVNSNLLHCLRRQAIMNAIVANAKPGANFTEVLGVLSAGDLKSKNIQQMNEILGYLGLPAIDGAEADLVTIEMLEQLVNEKFSKLSFSSRESIANAISNSYASAHETRKQKILRFLDNANPPSFNEFYDEFIKGIANVTHRAQEAIGKLKEQLPYLSRELRADILNAARVKEKDRRRLEMVLASPEITTLQTLKEKISAANIDLPADSPLKGLIERSLMDVVQYNVKQYLAAHALQISNFDFLVPNGDEITIEWDRLVVAIRGLSDISVVSALLEIAKEILKEQATFIASEALRNLTLQRIESIDNPGSLGAFVIFVPGSANYSEMIGAFKKLPTRFTALENLVTQAIPRFTADQIEGIVKAFGAHLDETQKTSLREHLGAIKLSDYYDLVKFNDFLTALGMNTDSYSFVELLRQESVRFLPNDKGNVNALRDKVLVAAYVAETPAVTEVLKALENNYSLNPAQKDAWRLFFAKTSLAFPMKGSVFVALCEQYRGENPTASLGVTSQATNEVFLPRIEQSKEIKSLHDLADAIAEQSPKLPYARRLEFIRTLEKYFGDYLNPIQLRALHYVLEKHNEATITRDGFNAIFGKANDLLSRHASELCVTRGDKKYCKKIHIPGVRLHYNADETIKVRDSAGNLTEETRFALDDEQSFEKAFAGLSSGMTREQADALRAELRRSDASEQEIELIIERFRSPELNYQVGLSQQQLFDVFGNRAPYLRLRNGERRVVGSLASSTSTTVYQHSEIITALKAAEIRYQKLIGQLYKILCLQMPTLDTPAIREKFWSYCIYNINQLIDENRARKLNVEEIISRLYAVANPAPGATPAFPELAQDPFNTTWQNFKYQRDLATASDDDVVYDFLHNIPFLRRDGYNLLNTEKRDALLNAIEALKQKNLILQHVELTDEKKRKLLAALVEYMLTEEHPETIDILNDPKWLNRVLAALDDEYTCIRLPETLGITLQDLMNIHDYSNRPVPTSLTSEDEEKENVEEILRILGFYAPTIPDAERKALYKAIMQSFGEDADVGIRCNMSEEGRKALAQVISRGGQIDPNWHPTREGFKQEIGTGAPLALSDDQAWVYEQGLAKRLIRASGIPVFFDLDAKLDEWYQVKTENGQRKANKKPTRVEVLDKFIYENFTSKQGRRLTRERVDQARKTSMANDAQNVQLNLSCNGDVAQILKKSLEERIIQQSSSEDIGIKSITIYKNDGDPLPAREQPTDSRNCTKLGNTTELSCYEISSEQMEHKTGTKLSAIDMKDVGSVVLKTQLDVEIAIYCQDISEIKAVEAVKNSDGSIQTPGKEGRQARAKGDVQLSNLDRTAPDFLEKVLDIILSVKKAGGFSIMDLSILSQDIPEGEDRNLPCNQVVFKAMCMHLNTDTIPPTLCPSLQEQAKQFYREVIKEYDFDNGATARLSDRPMFGA